MAKQVDMFEITRQTFCDKVREAIDHFAAIEDEALNQSVVGALLIQNSRDARYTTESEIAQAVEWASRIHMQVVTLQFFLAGAHDLLFVDGEPHFRMYASDPNAMMANLVRAGIAKPVDSPDSSSSNGTRGTMPDGSTVPRTTDGPVR